MKNIKRKIALTTVLSVFALLATFYYHSQKSDISDLQLMNVEALAGGEIYQGSCVGVGSIDCPMFNVKVYMVGIY